jgi:radical SAM protein with 4Fe4S-binding SPASM domain
MAFKSTANILSYGSPAKMANAVNILSSYYLSRMKRKPVMRGLPISASIEPTTACNLRCPQCPSGLRSFSRPTGKLDVDLYRHMLNELGSQLWYLTLYFQGEPYLNPHFTDLVSLANKKNIYTSTSSNAHFLNDENARKTVESGLDNLIVSVDGLTQETYEKYRISGKLRKVEEGLSNLRKWKQKLNNKSPHVVVQFIIMRHNEHEINKVRQWALMNGADEVQLKTAQIYDHHNGSDFLPENEEFARYGQSDSGTFEIKNKLLDHCWRMWHSCVITWDGNVVPCCFDKDAKYVMGNMADTSFKEIWNGGKYFTFRKQLFTNRKSIDICQDCTEGTKVWI